MSIASRINEIGIHLTKDWRSIEALTGTATVDKNIENIASVLDNLYETLPKSTGTGESLSLSTLPGKLKIDLLGNTSQTGTPTPSTPIPVNVVSGDNEVVVCGKNLFDKTSNIVLNKYIGGDGTIQNEALNWYQEDYIEVKPSTNYIMSTNSSQTVRIALYDENKTFISRVYSAGNIQATTTTATTKYIRLSGYNNINDNIMLNVGTTALPYEPYQSQTYEVDLGDIELCKIGDYQDYFYKNIVGATDYSSDRELGAWYLKKEIGTILFNETGTWIYNTSIDAMRRNTPYDNLINNSIITTISKYFIGVSFSNRNVGTNPRMYFENNYLQFKNTGYTSVDDFKNWLSTHSFDVYYILATPTYTKIEGTLASQLEDVWRANTYDNQTNVSQVNNDLPFIIDVSAPTYTINGMNKEYTHKEDIINKVTSISEKSTDTQYPSAKCVYDIIGNIESILENLDIGNGVS